MCISYKTFVADGCNLIVAIKLAETCSFNGDATTQLTKLPQLYFDYFPILYGGICHFTGLDSPNVH